MKKLLFIALVLLLTAAVVVAFVVMPKNLTMSDAVASEGDRVYLTVSLEKPVTTNAMGISYEYDASVLEPLRADNQWIPKGMLQDFSEFGSHGVWCSEESVDISGDVCTLVFRVLPNAEYKHSTVRCSLTFQNVDGEKKLTAAAKITPVCAHKYSSWVDTEQGEHTRTCSLCNYVQLQSHTWDRDKNDESSYTCTACGSRQTSQVNTILQGGAADGQKPWGSNISGNSQWGDAFGNNTTEPTQTPSSGNQTSSENQIPWGNHSNDDNHGNNNLSGKNQLGSSFGNGVIVGTTEPTQPNTSANNPWMEFYHQPDQETTAPTEESLQNQSPIWTEHLNTSIFQNATAPIEEDSEEDHNHSDTAPTVDSHEDHDHTQTMQRINPLTALVLLGVLILALVVALIFLKKKKHH